ncbi:unnamed protein product [Miscanthus lutarioriparius]|uniref:Uncharacterized protein n=1 Tax=Miscanthus lutarioriparius TaxID=422564 RepID=A0A811P281_9POAL|nr:unnamed protein product [Miscanthus lutarioriparius]
MLLDMLALLGAYFSSLCWTGARDWDDNLADTVVIDKINIFRADRVFKGSKYQQFWRMQLLSCESVAPKTVLFLGSSHKAQKRMLIEADNGLGEVMKPPEKSFWAKYWMYIIPLGLIVMNAVTTVAKRKLQGRANLEQNGHLLLLPGGEDDGCLYVFPYRRFMGNGRRLNLSTWTEELELYLHELI